MDRRAEFCGAKQSPCDDGRRPHPLYHSGGEKSAVGLARVAGESYPDPTAAEGDWSAVDLVPIKALARLVALSQIKADKILREMKLAKESRLSVSPVTREQFTRLLELSETKI